MKSLLLSISAPEWPEYLTLFSFSRMKHVYTTACTVTCLSCSHVVWLSCIHGRSLVSLKNLKRLNQPLVGSTDHVAFYCIGPCDSRNALAVVIDKWKPFQNCSATPAVPLKLATKLSSHTDLMDGLESACDWNISSTRPCCSQPILINAYTHHKYDVYGNVVKHLNSHCIKAGRKF